jgi:glycosyltransferase involved in cell wall biosynthesis
VPILVYSPADTAVSKFVTKNNCGYCVTDQSTEKIINAFKFLLSNEGNRKMLSNNAVRLSKELFDSKKVREQFQQLLINIYK